MKFRSSLVPTLLAITFAAGSAYAQTANASQNVTLNEKVQIPGASLKPGEYTFSVEDRLQDRAIVRITSQDQSKHFLVLTVPSADLGQAGSDGLVLFTKSSGKDQALRGWACPDCSPGLEFVYPKAEAAKLTDETGEAVLAVDPTYDKLPVNLSADDMKVVTLWLLSPERITAGNKGKGVKAEKYAGISRPPTDTQRASANSSEIAQSPAPSEQAATAPVVNSASTAAVSAPPSSTSEVAQAPAVAPAPALPAQASPSRLMDVASASSTPPTPAGSRRGRLPKTASDDYLYLFGGMLLMLAALGVRLSRGRVAVTRS